MTASELKETKAKKGRRPANKIDISQIRTIYRLARRKCSKCAVHDLPIKFFFGLITSANSQISLLTNNVPYMLKCSHHTFLLK
jgi:hypothetical protein